MQNATLGLEDVEEQALFDPLRFAMASRDADVMSMVRDALDAGRAQLAFQPVVTSGDKPHTVYHEGLVRLTDENGRMLPAGHFMPFIEESEMGRRIDCAALQLALRMLYDNPDARVSVNVSARSLGYGEWRRILVQGFMNNDLLGERLVLEISETSAMMLHENVIRFMHEMQPRGVGFALDGFGAGMTAFRYLKDFLFDLVKIDKGFIRGIDTNPDNQVLAEALITVAHQFEMFAVADGVETPQEAAFLTRFGVDCLQGYHIGVPTLTI